MFKTSFSWSDLKLILELVPNHSSYKCKWFPKSVRREGKYQDYYVWRNASNQDQLGDASIVPIPPNNWVSGDDWIRIGPGEN